MNRWCLVVMAMLGLGCGEDTSACPERRRTVGLVIEAQAGVVQAIELGGACTGASVRCLPDEPSAVFRPGCERYQVQPTASGTCSVLIVRSCGTITVQRSIVMEQACGGVWHGYASTEPESDVDARC